MIEFEYKKLADQVSCLIKEVDTRLEGLSDEIVSESAKHFQAELHGLLDRTKLEIAFVGQYSAGKSTIIRALTGNKNIVIGQDITTDRATAYAWGDHIVVDTPGIFTGRPNHDEISLKHMDTAHLIVYVVTINGFDSLIGVNFRELAFDHQRIGKMMLVVNKLSTEAEENQQQVTLDIEKVIEPASSEEVFLSVIDAKEYIDSFNEQEEEAQSELRQLSHFEKFVDQLNVFVKEKRLNGQLISPLNTINEGISHLINMLTADSDEVKKVQEAIRQKRFLVADCHNRVMRSITSEVRTLCASINEKGSKLATKIVDDAGLESLEDENERTLSEIAFLCDDTNTAIDRMVTSELQALDEKCGELMNSPLMMDLLRLGPKELDFIIEVKDCRMDERLKKLPEVISKIGDFLHTHSIGTKAASKGLQQVTGSALHEGLLQLGKMVNFKFKPYQAVKIVDKVGKLGKFLGLAQIILGPAIAWFEEEQEKKYKEEIKNVRISVRHNYQRYANAITDEYNIEILDKLNNYFVDILNHIDNDSEGLRSKSVGEQESVKQLWSLQAKAKSLLTIAERM